MKKHELLKHAYDNYPKGSIAMFKSAPNVKHISTGKFRIIEGTGNGTCVISENDNHCFYVSKGDEWAEIVKPKIAVKVESEKEFDALMKYYDWLGWNWCGGQKPLEYHNRVSNKEIGEECFPFHDLFDNGIVEMKIDQGYQIIHFSDFAKEHNIKLPLLTSEDGVDLYEGDEYFRVCDIGSKNINWVLITITESRDISGILEQGKTFQKNDKIFSTKQAALDWIEAQKPKTIYIKCCHEFIALVDKNRITWQGDKPNIITKETIVKIYNAMQELS